MTKARTIGRILRKTSLVLASALGLGACGGGGNPLNNPPQVANPVGASGQNLSFAYFQRCVNPILDGAHTIVLNGVTATNTCSSSGCHANATGRGGAFRVIAGAATWDLSNAGNTPAIIRGSDMYKNFLSGQGEVIVGNYAQSLLVNKPLVRNVLHGGGQIFSSEADPNIKKIEYWISNPMPAGQDEFSTAGYNLFTPADPTNGACNTLP